MILTIITHYNKTNSDINTQLLYLEIQNGHAHTQIHLKYLVVFYVLENLV